ncbi:MAG: phosphoribosylamine--glycine ligase [Candidatus Aenigmarchaeota archaeon]|nr:phosphoribosylamine--glycine ligase [Candidatus Aenigmarchaeota archaeon]
MKQNILIVGSGGREHALGWKLQKSPLVNKIFYAPGNGGTSENISINADEFEKLIEFSKNNNCFTIIGPENPLSKGIVNEFEKNGLKIFGPNKEATILESSKCWAKEFMKKYDIPTANFEIFDNAEDAKDYVKYKSAVVVKTDGLASGKGVIVCNSEEEALDAIEKIMVKKEFGDAGNKIVIEDLLVGEEASFIAITDGKTIIPLASSQDHKRVFDDDKGSNTGGMGAYSPAPIITDELHNEIMRDIMAKTVAGIRREKIVFKGFLYAGLMIVNNKPYVLEFNARMGDPECQPIVARMKSDLFPYLDACVNGNLEKMPMIEWDGRAAVCVVMASHGYPGNYEKGKVISGLEDVSKLNDAFVFHASTKKFNGNFITNGGRVLGVTALGNTIKDAINNVYDAVSKISWDDVHYRRDIGKKALKLTNSSTNHSI